MRCTEACQDWYCPDDACQFINHRKGETTGPYVCEDCKGVFHSVRLLVVPPVTTCEPTDATPALDTRYRIYVAGGSYAEIAPIVDSFVRGATLQKGLGLWESESESCIIVELIGTHEDAALIRTLATRLRDSFHQDCVLLTVEDVRGELI